MHDTNAAGRGTRSKRATGSGYCVLFSMISKGYRGEWGISISNKKNASLVALRYNMKKIWPGKWLAPLPERKHGPMDTSRKHKELNFFLIKLGRSYICLSLNQLHREYLLMLFYCRNQLIMNLIFRSMSSMIYCAFSLNFV